MEMFSQANKNYCWQPGRDDQTISVNGVLPRSEYRQMDIPAPESASGVTFSIRCAAVAAYCWVNPTGRHFAEIFITVSRKVSAVYRAVRRFVRRTAAHLQMTLALRRTVFLRL